MPPPGTVTTAGYWGSAYWSKGYWGADYWKERIPVPVPVPVPSGGGGGGGGGFISGAPLAPLIPCEMEDDRHWLGRLRHRPGKSEQLAKAIAKKISDEIRREAGVSGADPLAVPRRLSPDKVREADLRKLRERIRQLETEAARGGAARVALEATIGELHRIVAGLQEQIDRLQTPRLAYTRRPAVEEQVAAAVRAAVAPETLLEGAEFQEALAQKILSATLAAATEPARIRTKLAPDPLAGVWKLLGAAGLAIVVDRIQEPPWLRTVGFGAAMTLGASGAAELLGVKKIKETVE